MVTILTPFVFIAFIWLLWQMTRTLPSKRRRPWIRVTIGLVATFTLSFLVVGSAALFVVGVVIGVHSSVALPRPLAILVALVAITSAIAFPVFVTVRGFRRYRELMEPASGGR